MIPRTAPAAADVTDELDFGYAIVGHTVDLFEIRPDWRDRTVVRQRPFARIRYVRTADEWRLYWMRADLRWRPYQPAPVRDSPRDVLAEVDKDLHGCFFGCGAPVRPSVSCKDIRYGSRRNAARRQATHRPSAALRPLPMLTGRPCVARCRAQLQ